jgi:hypothetical protein
MCSKDHPPARGYNALPNQCSPVSRHTVAMVVPAEPGANAHTERANLDSGAAGVSERNRPAFFVVLAK